MHNNSSGLAREQGSSLAEKCKWISGAGETRFRIRPNGISHDAIRPDGEPRQHFSAISVVNRDARVLVVRFQPISNLTTRSLQNITRSSWSRKSPFLDGCCVVTDTPPISVASVARYAFAFLSCAEGPSVARTSRSLCRPTAYTFAECS